MGGDVNNKDDMWARVALQQLWEEQEKNHVEREKELNNNSQPFKNNINLIKYDSIVEPLYFTYKFGFSSKLAKIYLN